MEKTELDFKLIALLCKFHSINSIEIKFALSLKNKPKSFKCQTVLYLHYSTFPSSLVNLIRVGKCKLRLIITHVRQGWNAKLLKGWLELLQHVRPEFCLLIATLDLYDLQNPGKNKKKS